MNNQDKFDYIYSAPTEDERREIESIKKQYAAEPKRPKLEELRNLNKRVTRPPKITGLVAGIAGALIMGTGMAMAIEWNLMVWGVVVGAAGMVLVGVAYPIYRVMLKRNKRKYGGQILELSNQLLNTEVE